MTHTGRVIPCHNHNKGDLEMKKLSAGALVVFMLLFIFSSASALAAEKAKKDVLAKIGTKEITKSEVEAYAGLYPEQQQALIKADPRMEEVLVRNLVSIMVVSDVAKKKGLEKDPTIRKQIDIMKNEYLARTYIQKEVLGKIKLTDKDYEAYYNAHKKEFENPEMVRARHILVAVKPNATEEEKKAALKKAEDILEKAKKGEDFAKLASEYSDDPGSKAKGGDLGFFSAGSMVGKFEQAAFTLKPGEISPVVETEFGYHIIKVEERKAAEQQPYDAVKDQVIAKATQTVQQERLNAFLEKAMKDAKVTFYGPEPPKEQ
jgi:peptidyl-prolyl cis-trans isomerase C